MNILQVIWSWVSDGTAVRPPYRRIPCSTSGCGSALITSDTSDFDWSGYRCNLCLPESERIDWEESIADLPIRVWRVSVYGQDGPYYHFKYFETLDNALTESADGCKYIVEAVTMTQHEYDSLNNSPEFLQGPTNA